MARMVPVGMDFWASRRSPERLEPAMMPGGKRDSATVGRATALAHPSQQDSSHRAPAWWHARTGSSHPAHSPLPASPPHSPPSSRSLTPFKD